MTAMLVLNLPVVSALDPEERESVFSPEDDQESNVIFSEPIKVQNSFEDRQLSDDVSEGAEPSIVEEKSASPSRNDLYQMSVDANTDDSTVDEISTSIDGAYDWLTAIEGGSGSLPFLGEESRHPGIEGFNDRGGGPVALPSGIDSKNADTRLEDCNHTNGGMEIGHCADYLTLNDEASVTNEKNRSEIVGGRSSDDTEQLGEFAVTNDNEMDTLLTVEGLAIVRDTGVSAKYNKLEIYRLGSVVEVTLWYYGYLNTWVLETSQTLEISFPINTAFTVTIYRYSKIGWLFCRHRAQNSVQILSCNTLQGGSYAKTDDSTTETLIDVSNLGRITDSTTDAHQLILYSYGSYVEWSYWDGDPSYNQNWISPWSQTTIIFDHYRSFIVTIYRANKIGWIFCRENGNQVKCSTKQGGLTAYTGDTTEETLVNVPGLGKVTDSGIRQQTEVPQQLKIYSWTGSLLVYSIWHNNNYNSGSISYPGTYATVQVPWYKSFTMSIQSPSYADARITWLFCRVNDLLLTCHTLSITTQRMNKLDWDGLDSNAETVDKTMDIDEGIFTDSGDKVEVSLETDDYFYELDIYAYCKDLKEDGTGELRATFEAHSGVASCGLTSYVWVHWYWGGLNYAPGTYKMTIENVNDNSATGLKEDSMDAYVAVIVVKHPGTINADNYFRIDESSWRNMDSDDTWPHMDIGNYALFWHDGDYVLWSGMQISQDSVKIGILCKSHTSNAHMQLYIDTSSKGTHTITSSVWHWYYFDRWDDVSSGSHTIKLKHREYGGYGDSDIGIIHLRLIF